MTKKDKEQEQKQETEAARIEKQRREGTAALDKARADEAAKTDEEKTSQAELAQQQQEATAKEETDRVTADQKGAAEKLEQIAQEAKANKEAERVAADEKGAAEELSQNEREAADAELALPSDTRLLKAGTVLHLNGEPAVLPVDGAVVIAGAAVEQRFASILARDPANFALNADRLRLVYNPMNAAPLPADAQRLTFEEMTEQERAVFGPAGPPADAQRLTPEEMTEQERAGRTDRPVRNDSLPKR